MKQGQTHSAESRAKISAAMKGKQKSMETREKMVAAATIRWARERSRRKKLLAIMSIGETPAEPANSVTEAFDAAGTPVS